MSKSPEFKVGDRVRHKELPEENTARVLYVGARLYVLEAEHENERVWEFAETIRFVESTYELVPPKWEVGKKYKHQTGRRFIVTAVDDAGHALGRIQESGMGEWRVGFRQSQIRLDWDETKG